MTRKLTDADRAAIPTLYAEGLTMQKIAERLGVTRATIGVALRKAGVKARPKGFAGMSKDKARAIRSNGGRSIAPENRTFSQNRALAAEAGRKGGKISRGGGRKAAAPVAAE